MKWIAVALMPVAAFAEVEQGPPNADFEPFFPEQTRAAALPATDVTVEIFAAGLVRPWGIAGLGDGRWLVTEKPGDLRVIFADGSLSAPVAGVPEVASARQGGLLDVAYADGVVFLTYAKALDGGYVTAAARGVLVEEGGAFRLEEVRDIFVQAPVSEFAMHYGARIVPDGDFVWITTGEHSNAAERVRAQDVGTTYGVVARVYPDGSVPEDNPFVGADGIDTIWSFGHRNIQGATIGPDGGLWTVEHGPRGGDELNRPEAGLNYGWPVISYGINYSGTDVGEGLAVREGMEQPVYYWDPVIAPGGMAFYEGDLFDWQGDLLIGSLNPGALVRLRMEDGLVVGEERVITDQGRIRDVEVMPDGSVLLLVDADPGAVLRVVPRG